MLTKDANGKFSSLNKDKDFTFADKVTNHIEDGESYKYRDGAGYLIYIVTQEVLFNDEISTITYFKDITFGVLYEQIKM